MERFKRIIQVILVVLILVLLNSCTGFAESDESRNTDADNAYRSVIRNLF